MDPPLRICSTMIFYRKGPTGKTNKKTGEPVMYNLERRINDAVFPGLQGGPHNHTISGLAVALKMAAAPEFREYQEQVLSNSQALAGRMQAKGYELVSGGTSNHLCLIDLRPKGVDGARAERIMEMAHIAGTRTRCPGTRAPSSRAASASAPPPSLARFPGGGLREGRRLPGPGRDDRPGGGRQVQGEEVQGLPGGPGEP